MFSRLEKIGPSYAKVYHVLVWNIINILSITFASLHFKNH